MLHRFKLFLRFGPSVFEETHKRFFRLILLIPITTLIYHLHEIYELRREFIHKPDLWLMSADCLVVALDAFFLVCVALHLVLRRIGHPLPASRFVGITSLPDCTKLDSAWRYSIVDAATVRGDNPGGGGDGLEVFAAISESFATITGANPDLSPKARRRLYLKWFRRNPSAFLTLEHRNWYGGWSVVAISIILPLTRTGRDDLVAGNVSIKTFRRGDIEAVGVTPATLLIDTLIISKRFHRWTEAFAFPGLPIRHIAEFWRRLPRGWTVLVEPDDRKLEEKLLVKLGFRRFEDRDEGSPLYILSSDMVVSERLAESLQRLEANLAESGTWPLHVAGRSATRAAESPAS